MDHSLQIRPFMTRIHLSVFLFLLAACAPESPVNEILRIENSAGKADRISLILQQSEASPNSQLGIFCEGEFGCDGTLSVRVLADACGLLAQPDCGTGLMDAAALDIASVVVSAPSGDRVLPLRVATEDGSYFAQEVSIEFEADLGEMLGVRIQRADGAPDVQLAVEAVWEDRVGAPPTALESFLDGLPNARYYEGPTTYEGYRVYVIDIEQPLDHDNPSAGTFEQRVFLHHRDEMAPMTLFSTGYQLRREFLAELTESMTGNQLSVEHRFFGDSMPNDATGEVWEHLNVRSAAADLHRIVELFKPFYAAPWLSTGHSKGGMTSLFHMYFHPDDVAMTVPYVAPYSTQPRDPRYIEHLDSIGETECRERLRGLARGMLERLDEILPMLEAEALENGARYDLSGGIRAAAEDRIETHEWEFWQVGENLDACWIYPSYEDVMALHPEEALGQFQSWIGAPREDRSLQNGSSYEYQVLAELGSQAFANHYLGDALQSPNVPLFVPSGAPEPTFDGTLLAEIQEWVLRDEAPIVFVYGEYDPWTGGRYEVPESGVLVRSFTAPAAFHGADIRSLSESDREEVLTIIEGSMGTRPDLGFAAGGPAIQPRLLHEGLR